MKPQTKPQTKSAGHRATKVSMTANELKKQIENEIISGELEPGDRLDEQSLASRFGVSRTPVREALRQLSGAELIKQVPNKGAVVATLTLTQMVEMFEVMSELEGLCARLAARRMTKDERDQLAACHKQSLKFAENGDVNKYYEANARFHEVVYKGSHNQFLEQTTRTTRNRLAPYRRYQLHHPGRLMDSFWEHDAVEKAILSGNGDKADELIRAHVSVQGDVFTDFITTLPKSLLGEKDHG